MAQSAFRVTSGKRIPDTVNSNCISGAIIDSYPMCTTEGTRIIDEVELKYSGFICPQVGDIVRFDGTVEGYTLADARLDMHRADPEELAEAIGVVEELIDNCGPDYTDNVKAKVVYFGKVDFTNHMKNQNGVTKQLTPGKVYYLADSEDEAYDKTAEAGYQFRNGTTNEPRNISKPVYIATSRSTAIVTNFRGLMGGQRDIHGDELIVTITCRPFGFLVEIKNNGKSAWKLPITRMKLELDHLEDPTALPVEPIYETQWRWVTSNPADSTGAWSDTTGVYPQANDPFANGGSLILGPGDTKEIVVGTKQTPQTGHLKVILYTVSPNGTEVERKVADWRCVPHLSIAESCGTTEIPSPHFIVEHLNFGVEQHNPVMENEAYINYLVQELDSTDGLWKDLQVKNASGQLVSSEGAFNLPERDAQGNIGKTAHLIEVEDAVGSSNSGQYRITFTNVVEGHWAYSGPETSLGEPTVLACESECDCDSTTNCLIFPDNQASRVTMGPTEEGGFDLETGLINIGANGYPQYGLIVDEADAVYGWYGDSSRGDNKMCGSPSGPDALRLNPYCVIPTGVGICLPKLTESEVDIGGGFAIKIYRTEAEADAYITLDFGDIPKSESATMTVMLDYNTITETFDRCFNLPLSGRNKTYYLDEIF